MSGFLLLLGGGLAWVALRGQPDLLSFVFGLLLTLAVFRRRLRWRGEITPARLARGTWAAIRLLFYFTWEVMVSNIEQFRLVFSPRMNLRPAWISFETRLEGSATRAFLGILISMTPGTLTCRVDGSTVWIHALHAGDEKAIRELIRRRFELPLRALEV